MRSKAVVPASKAKIGEIYAVMHEGKLTRFRVDRVTIHRDRDDGSPHDYTSEVTGYFIFSLGEGHDINTVKAARVDGTRTLKATIEPTRLLGKFEEYKELLAQEQAEKAAKEATKRANEEAAAELWRVLYTVADLPRPNDPTEWYQPFKIGGYAGKDQIDVGQKGVAPLLAGLKRLIADRLDPVVKLEVIDITKVEDVS